MDVCLGESYVCVCLRVVTESSRGRQIPLRLELKEVVNHLTWVWGLNSGPLQEQYML